MSHAEIISCMPHGMRVRTRMCSLKIRQFVLTLKHKLIFVYA
jgi:hypothetical protein